MYQISKNLANHLEILKFISNAKSPKLQKRLLSDFYNKNRTKFYKCFQELALNLCNNNIKVHKNKCVKLKKYKHLILKLCKNPKNKKIEKRLIVQSGGFLGALLPIALTTLGNIVVDKLLPK